MGKDFESWPHQWEPDGQFSNSKSLNLPFDLGMQNPDIPCAIPCTNAVPLNHAMPAFGFSGLPHFRQGLIPDITLHEKFLPKINPSPISENCREANTLVIDGGHALKQYLLFDQTGSKTTMVYSSGIGPPIQQLNPWSSRPTGYHNKRVDGEVKLGSSVYYHSGPSFANELDVNHGTDDGSEMCEDSEEINALLYSDDEDNYIEEGEETSTGHSPGNMTAYEKQDWFEEEDMDEVASSAGPVKRQKLSDRGCYEVPSVTNASSSVKPNRSREYEDDAESSCVGGKPIQCSNDMGSLWGNKRLNKEKLHETVSILQTIIPGGKGKDAVMVLDEAIDYLRSLKYKASSAAESMKLSTT